MIAHWTLIAAVAAASVLPPPARPRTKRLSRGPAWTDNLSRLAVTKDEVRAAKESLGEKRRVAVVGVPQREASESQPIEFALVAADVIRTGVRYGNNLMVTDGITSQNLFASTSDDEAIRSIAQERHIDAVAVVNIDAADHSLAVRLLLPEGSSKELEPIQLGEGDNAVVDAAVKMRRNVLMAFDALPATNLDQLAHPPMADAKAITQLLKAKQILAGAIRLPDAAARAPRYQEALALADEALKGSPKYLSALIVKASCHDELGSDTKVQDTLTMAIERIDDRRHDRLASLELRADYIRFVSGDGFKAMKAYQTLLKSDPTNLSALWAIVDVLMTGDRKSPIDPETLAYAKTFAAKLVATHPDSGVAKAIMSGETP